MTVDFNDYFWGEKNDGFDVLYHNMKYGLAAGKDLSEFLRERSNIEESNCKLMSKLATKATSGCNHGTFAPVWVVLKGSAERLSSLHSDMVKKITELVKEIAKYAEELHRKHKNVKEEEAGTLDAVQSMQSSTVAVQKAKDLYTARLQELEKLKKDTASAKELEKAEVKLKKQQEEYKNLVEKHNPIKLEFERRMTITCKRFQDIEESHLLQMRDFVTTYIELIQTNYDMVGQVHQDFKRQFLDMTVDKLLEQFVLNKYTGLEKPENIGLDLMNWPAADNNNGQSKSTNNAEAIVQPEITPSSSILIESSAITGQSMSVSPTLASVGSSSGKRELSIRSWFSPTASNHQRINSEPKVVDLVSVSSTEAQNSPPTIVTSSAIPKRKDGRGELSELDSGTQEAQTNVVGGVATTNSTTTSTATVAQNSKDKKEKPSRRTTSLLNLFMSNSQGSRDPPLEVFSAPTSPSPGHLMDQQQTQLAAEANAQTIKRNPLRGSKFSGFLRSRREKAKTKKVKKKKDSPDNGSTKEDPKSDNEDKSESSKKDPLASVTTAMTKSPSSIAPTATPEVDEDGYSVQPKGVDGAWSGFGSNTEKGFYSSSESDSDDNEHTDRKIHVEIKPLKSAPISASVDELRATVETLTLSGTLSQSNHSSQSKGGSKPLNVQSPLASNASSPTATHPYAPLQSPTLSMSNNSTNRYADLGDIFSEVAEITGSVPGSATSLSKVSGRQIPTPTSATSNSSIAIPRPPSRRSGEALRGRISPLSASIARTDSVGSLEFRTASVVGMGSSRGPSPLTIGMSDTIPIAVAFHEIIHAYFRGSDESRCQVKISGDMMVSFPSGIVAVLMNNPTPPKLGFKIKSAQNLDNLLPNKQLVVIDSAQSTAQYTVMELNMVALTTLLRKQFEQSQTASYFNVDILKYQVKSKPGASSCPFQLVSYWKCEPKHTDLKIDYKYNSHAMVSPSPLLNVTISIPVDGGVRNVQSKPHSAWLGESNRLAWNFTDLSLHSDNSGVGTLRARLEVTNGPSTPAILSTQFNCEGTTLSGIEFELAGTGYRLSLVKRRFVSGKFICEGDTARSESATPTLMTPATKS